MVVHHVGVNMRVCECVNVCASHTHADTHTHVCIQHVGASMCAGVCECKVCLVQCFQRSPILQVNGSVS